MLSWHQRHVRMSCQNDMSLMQTACLGACACCTFLMMFLVAAVVKKKLIGDGAHHSGMLQHPIGLCKSNSANMCIFRIR